MARGRKRDPGKEITPVMREITELRISLGETQAGFGELLGVATGTVKDWENGRRTPDRRSRIAIEELKGGDNGEV